MFSSGKKFPYVVILKSTTDRAYTLLAILLNLASAVIFVLDFFARDHGVGRIIGFVPLMALLAWGIIASRKGQRVYFHYAYFISGLLWMSMPYLQWLFIPFFILAVLERQVRLPLEIGFSETQIVLNTLYKKKYQWSELSNVMLRDGLLTVDFKNNRILQREIEDDDDDDDASEEEFNLFCRQQLKKNPF